MCLRVCVCAVVTSNGAPTDVHGNGDREECVCGCSATAPVYGIICSDSMHKNKRVDDLIY